ncbi:ATP-binding protein [Methylobacterium sp. B4]|uniref:ATP-binding protein n=1 Tax=Methylobacterium sp. B4 TaxID=1938755 RepID=UPI000D9A0AFC|nr:ATP-binding protein [Methylobacterium sp. B4]PXW52401.1 signal transduction histidine kinase [Methylobacterium sp. B4]
MSDRAGQAGSPEGDPVLADALARWREETSTAHLVREGAPFLVFDAGAEAILHAAGSALALRAGIAALDGTVLPSLRLGEQIRRAGSLEGRPRLVRLRLDPRGVASPVVGLAARVAIEPGRSAILLAPIGALPTLRPADVAKASAATIAVPEDARPVEADKSSEAVNPVDLRTAEPPAPVETAEVPARFVWRSDAEGVLTHLSPTHPDLAEVLTGRDWQGLAADGVIEGAAFAGALTERRTFRALPLVVRGRLFEHALEMSGAPAGRPNQDFSGLGGFAILGERRPRPVEADDKAGEALRQEVLRQEVLRHEALRDAADWEEGDRQEADQVESEQTAGRTDRAADESGSGEIPSDGGEAGLSVNEHAAFREVARLLGLRFAADESALEEGPAPPRADLPSGGSVTPFPMPPGRLAEAEGRARSALAELLESLPLGVLVYRDGEALFASRAFLDLTGYADLSALRRAGLDHLFRGLPPSERRNAGATPFAGAEGSTVALLVDHAHLVWEGAAAEICLVRALPAAATGEAPLVPPNAARLRAEKVLDSLEEGVVTLDGEGRVVGLNPSAAELVHAHPREIVGGRFADLFSPDSLPALEAAVTDSRDSGASELHAVTARTGAAALRLRIARLLGEDAPGYCASLREIRDEAPAVRAIEPARREEAESVAIWKANALARVSREIRPSLNAILSLTDMMLSDRFDRADAERLEAYLREVRLSGGRIGGLIDDLRDLAEIQAGRSHLTFADLALNDLVASCIAARQAQAARDRIVLRTSLAPDLPLLRADERSIRQATLTVLGNAIQASEAGGQVIVSTTLAERGEVALRVRDTGAGMSEDEMLSALEPFRADAGPAEGEEKGFGLPLTKALVEANRGRFRISSRKAEGTLIEMMFPAA